MRIIPEAMQAALNAGVTTHCWCLRTERRDGRVDGFTDHDGDLVWAGVRFRSDTGFGLTNWDAAVGLAGGQGDLAGAISAAGISDEDLATGLWNGAHLALWRVDWRDPVQRVRVATGTLGEVRRRDGGFEADWLGLAQALERQTGRRFTRECDARLGDERCQLATSHPAFALGCDRRFSTCRERFGNTINFQGFPYMVGNDVLIAGAAGEPVRDGSSRGLGR